MSTSVSMPALGESVSEGTVTRWLKHEGDQVAADEPLLEVSTDKVDTEIPSPAAGVLQKILVQEDETVAVGAELAVIGDGAAESQDGQHAEAGQQSEQQPEPEQPPQDQQTEQQQQPQPQQAEQQQPQPQQAEQQQPQPQQAEQQQPQPQQPETPAAEARPQQPAESAQTQPDPAPQSSNRGGGAGDATGGTTVTMPALGESVSEGTVTRWLKKEGDQVTADEALLEVSTDKVDTEIPAPATGVLQKILVAEDQTVAVGTELAMIGGSSGSQESSQAAPAAGERAPAQAPVETAPVAQAAPPVQAAPAQPEAPTPQAAPAQHQAPPRQAEQPERPEPSPSPTDSSGSDSDGNAYVTPLVRKLAGEHGVDLANLTGTGVGGRIRKQDVLEAAAAKKAQSQTQEQAPASEQKTTAPAAGTSPLRGTTEQMSRLRKVIAARMVESLQVSAQLTTVVEVDLTRIARLRGRTRADFEAREHVKLSFLPFLAKATIEALKAHPRLNASIDTDKGEITYFDAEHLGVAVDTERGLLVPVIKNAGDLNIAGLARKIADLADRTRNNKITPDELGGGTFTLTNTGSRGALFDTPIINQPQVAILGTGAVVKRPVVVDDPDLGETIAIRSMCYLALSYDHRLVDGADAARFLSTVKARLEEGQFESDLSL